MAVEVARIEQATGKKVQLPGTEKDRLGFRRLKHAPKASEPSSAPEVSGREPPSGTSWGDD